MPNNKRVENVARQMLESHGKKDWADEHITNAMEHGADHDEHQRDAHHHLSLAKKLGSNHPEHQNHMSAHYWHKRAAGLHKQLKDAYQDLADHHESEPKNK